MSKRRGLDFLLDLKDAVDDYIRTPNGSHWLDLKTAYEACETYEDREWARKIEGAAKKGKKKR